MAMDKDDLGVELANFFLPEDATQATKNMVQKNWKGIADIIIKHIIDNAEIKTTIPSGTYIQTVSGGSGAPAVGASNLTATDITGIVTA